jgi:AraC family transcriptional regulator
MVEDSICVSGQRDRVFEERHSQVSIAMVLAGSFQYRAQHQCRAGGDSMTPGSLLLVNAGQYFECVHEHGAGDRCLSFHYSSDYFGRIVAGAGGVGDIAPATALGCVAATKAEPMTSMTKRYPSCAKVVAGSARRLRSQDALPAALSHPFSSVVLTKRDSQEPSEAVSKMTLTHGQSVMATLLHVWTGIR